MIRAMVQKIIRRASTKGLVALAAALALGLPVSSVDAHEGAEPRAESSVKQVAQVKVEVKTEAGRVIKGDLQLDWGAPGTVEMQGDGKKHIVGLELVRETDDSKVLKVTLRYHVDDHLVVAPYTFDTKLKKREVVHIEGGSAIALTVTPKKVKAPPPPAEEEKPRDKIDVGDADPRDPLGGLE